MFPDDAASGISFAPGEGGLGYQSVLYTFADRAVDGGEGGFRGLGRVPCVDHVAEFVGEEQDPFSWGLGRGCEFRATVRGLVSD